MRDFYFGEIIQDNINLFSGNPTTGGRISACPRFQTGRTDPKNPAPFSQIPAGGSPTQATATMSEKCHLPSA